MRGSGGFSLAELLVAIVIFAFGILASTALLGTGYRYQGHARWNTRTTVLAEMKLEDLRALAGTETPDTVALLPGGSLTADLAGYRDTVELDGREFARRWQIVGGPVNVRTITLQVRPVDHPAAVSTELSTHLLHD